MINKKEVIKKIEKNKRAMTQLKAYFLIINVVLAIVAFGWLIELFRIDNKKINYLDYTK